MKDSDRIAALEADVATLKRVVLAPATVPADSYHNGMRDLRPDGTVMLEAYQNLPQEVHHMLAEHRAIAAAAGVNDYALGTRFVVPAAIETFGITGDLARLIRRSTATAGTDFNVARFAYADLTSDEKLPNVTSFHPSEDPAEVIAQLVEYVRRDRDQGADPADPRFVAGSVSSDEE